MIKVYVVDDEKLVRRGIIGLIDWEKYGMEVIGDAGSGEEALTFLAKEKADLLFSDLEMPGLSGMPFLRKVKDICPDMKIVVLTMHQEFEQIQQALRIGILDYITKEQIEEENIDTLMHGVVKRYQETMRYTQLQERKITTGQVYIWETEGEKEGDRAAEILERNHFRFETLDETHLLLSGNCNLDRLKYLMETSGLGWFTLIELKQVKDVPCSQLTDSLRTVMKRRLFADRCPGCFVYSYIYPELQAEQAGISRKEVMELCVKMEFMVNEDCYASGMEKIKNAALSPEERKAVFYSFNLYWSEFSDKDITQYFDEVGEFQWWYQWKEWFDRIRQQVLQKARESDEEVGTMEAVHRAMNYIREHMDREISLDELLRLTGMSKSRFSRNFKRITGKTFVTYLNDMRIDSAKKYLTGTTQSVYWIARQVGYADERYFRRIFKERTGENPKKYRENNQEQI